MSTFLIRIILMQALAAQPHPDNVGPHYPAAARNLLIAGDVTFRALVSADGRVEDILILSVPEKGLGSEDAVREAVSHWRFTPAQAEGRTTSSYYLGRIPFELRPEDERSMRELVHHASRLWRDGAPESFSELFHPAAAVLSDGRVFRHREGVRRWIEDDDGRTIVGTAIRRIVFYPGRFAFVFVEPAWRLSVLQVDEDWLVVSWERSDTAGELELPERVPDEAADAGIGGVVVLQGLIDHEGAVRHLEVVSSASALDARAVAIARRWRFRPARRNGIAMPIVMTLTVGYPGEAP